MKNDNKEVVTNKKTLQQLIETLLQENKKKLAIAYGEDLIKINRACHYTGSTSKGQSHE